MCAQLLLVCCLLQRLMRRGLLWCGGVDGYRFVVHPDCWLDLPSSFAQDAFYLAGALVVSFIGCPLDLMRLRARAIGSSTPKAGALVVSNGAVLSKVNRSVLVSWSQAFRAQPETSQGHLVLSAGRLECQGGRIHGDVELAGQLVTNECASDPRHV